MMKRVLVVVVAVCAVVGAFAATTDDYVQDGLIACWDGYENVGRKMHEDSPSAWIDVKGGRALELAEGDSFNGDEIILTNVVRETAEELFDAAGDITIEVNGRPVSTTDALMLFVNVPNFAAFGWDYRYGAITIRWVDSAAATKYHYRTYASGYTDAATLAASGVYQTYSALIGVGSSAAYVNGVAKGTTTGLNYTGDARSDNFRLRVGHANAVSAIRSIRIYNRKLTAAEVAANRAVDVKRFEEGDMSGEPGVCVNGVPQNYGTAGLPVYGVIAQSAGEVVSLAAPDRVDLPDSARAECRGWKLYDGELGKLLEESTDATRLVCSFTYEKPVRLVWQWDVRYPVTVSAAEGLTVTPESAWGSASAPAEFTVSGADFPLWSDGGLGGDVHAKTVAFAPTNATAVTVAKAVVREPTSFAGLAAEIASAEAGDVIIVPDGTHSLADVTAEQMAADYAVTVDDVLVTSRSGDPKDVVFDLGGTGHGFTLNAAGARLKGVTFTSSADMTENANRALFVNVIAGALDACAFTNIVFNGGNDESSRPVDLAADGVIENCRFENLSAKPVRLVNGTVCAAGGIIRKTVFRACNLRFGPVRATGAAQVLIEDCQFTGIKSTDLGKHATSAACYGGPFVVRRTLIANNTLHGSNAAGYAGVAYLTSLSRFEDCIITNNVSASDYGCFNGNVVCDRCLIADNTGAQMGVAAGGQTASTFRNCLIRGNVGGTAGVSSGGTQAKAFKFENCTVTGNKTKAGTGPALSLGSCGGTYAGWVKNCIVYGNGSQATDAQMAIDADKAYTCCYPEAAEDNVNGNISADPQLNADGTLKYTSPCLDVALDLSSTAGIRDLVGTVRPQLSTDVTVPLWDMGCYEMPPNEEPLVVTLTIDQTFGVSPAMVTATADVKGTKTTGLTYDWTIVRTTPNGVTTNTVPAQADSSYTFTNLEPGTYSVSVTVKNDRGDSAPADCEDTFSARVPVCHVARGGNATWPYDTLEKATLNLGDAIGCAGERVEIDAGEYSAAELGTMTDPIQGDTFLAVVSTPIEVIGAGPEETKFILDGTVAAFCVANEGAVVGGFTVSGAGRTDASFSGSSVRVAPGVVSNVVVRDGAVWGSAVNVGYGGLFTHGLVTNVTNHAKSGSDSVPVTLGSGTIADTLIAGNTGYGCGAVYVNSVYLSVHGRILRTKIVGNTALKGASALSVDRIVDLVDTDIIGNDSTFKTGGGPVISANYSSSYNGYVRMTNCRIMDNRIFNCTAAIDAGACTTVIATNVLVAGNVGVEGIKPGACRTANFHLSSTVSLCNCTITGNTTAHSVNAGVSVDENHKNSTKKFVNCIIWGNCGTNGVGSANFKYVPGTEVPTVVRNTCWPEAPDADGNTSGDPKFRTSRRYRYYPSSTGSCYGTGDATFWTADDVDLAGKPRKHDGAVDIGCYSIPPQPGLMLMLK